jgi:hypothetical protein
MRINIEENKADQTFEVNQEFDLQEIFDVDFEIPQVVHEAFGQEVIDIIRERTAKSKDINGNPLPSPYSESYADSLEFKAWGKSRNKVNMKLTGEMLDSMDILDIDGNVLKVGFEGLEATKAFAHNTGFEGHPVLEGKVAKRKFFGVTKDEVNKIKNRLKDLLERSKEATQEEDALALGAIELLESRNDLVSFNIEDLFNDED